MRSGDDDHRPLLVGEAPSKSGDRFWRYPMSGSPARVLCKAAGIPPADGGGPGQWTWALYDSFACRNVLKRYPGAQGTGASFPMAAAREAALAMRADLRPVVVMCGRRVADAFTCAGAEYHDWFDLGRPAHERAARAVVIPHPSGLNRLLNDPAERERVGATLREALRLAAEVPGVLAEGIDDEGSIGW